MVTIGVGPAGRSALVRAVGWLPRGHALPAEVWEARHRWVTSILAWCGAAIPVFAVFRGFEPAHALLEAVGPVAMAALATVPRLGRSVRSSLSAVGLMLSASLVVHLSAGVTEAHFLFFVMVPIVALYECWAPFGMAVGFVLFQHGVVGTVHSEAVYSHAGGQDRPWLWAAIHAVLFAAACLGSIVSWRLHEQARENGLQLARARAALAQQAHTDPLTGLRNRLGLEADLAQLQRDAELHGRTFCLALCDIDLFKAYNDTYGHPLGDQALRTVAATFTQQLRGSDRVYRFGGEEFLVLLPEQSAAGGTEAVDRVRSALECKAIEHRGAGANAVLTMSAGLACSRPGRRLTSSQLLAQADAALYAAKRTGRNRTVHANGPACASTVAG